MKALSFLQSLARKQFVWVGLFEKTFIHFFYLHGFRYGCSRISSSFGRLFLDPRMGNILFNAKHRMSKQNTHTYTKGSRKLSISIFSDYYKTVASYLSGGNEGYSYMRVHKPTVAYKLVQLYSKNPKGAPSLAIIKTISNLTPIN